ncbi:MAG: hypothetical protein U1F49_20490 [Rubrivivax sp.]
MALPAAQEAEPGSAGVTADWTALRALLADSDSQALVLWTNSRTAFLSALPAPAAQRLDQAMQHCDFDAALACLPAEEAVA